MRAADMRRADGVSRVGDMRRNSNIKRAADVSRTADASYAADARRTADVRHMCRAAYIKRAALILAAALMLSLSLCACSGTRTPTEAEVTDAVMYAMAALRAANGEGVPTAGDTVTVGGAERRAVDPSWMADEAALVAYIEGAFTETFFAVRSAAERVRYDDGGGALYCTDGGALFVRVDGDGVSVPSGSSGDFDIASLVVVSASSGVAEAQTLSRDKATLRTWRVTVKKTVAQPDTFIVESYADAGSAG